MVGGLLVNGFYLLGFGLFLMGIGGGIGWEMVWEFEESTDFIL